MLGLYGLYRLAKNLKKKFSKKSSNKPLNHFNDKAPLLTSPTIKSENQLENNANLSSDKVLSSTEDKLLNDQDPIDDNLSIKPTIVVKDKDDKKKKFNEELDRKKKAYKMAKIQNDERWQSVIDHRGQTNTIKLIDQKKVGNTMKRMEHFNLLIDDKNIAKKYNKTKWETDLSMAYTLPIPENAKKLYRGSSRYRRPTSPGFNVPDKYEEVLTGIVYEFNVKYYETLPDLNKMKLPKTPLLLVIRDSNEYILWGQKSKDFEFTRLEFNKHDKNQINHWARGFHEQ